MSSLSADDIHKQLTKDDARYDEEELLNETIFSNWLDFYNETHSTIWKLERLCFGGEYEDKGWKQTIRLRATAKEQEIEFVFEKVVVLLLLRNNLLQYYLDFGVVKYFKQVYNKVGETMEQFVDNLPQYKDWFYLELYGGGPQGIFASFLLPTNLNYLLIAFN